MANWRVSTWGDEISLEYGKGIRDYSQSGGAYRVFGSNGPIGWTSEPISGAPGVILGRKGAYRGVSFSKEPFYVIDTAYYIRPKAELDMRWLYYAVIYYELGKIDDGSPIPSTTRSAVYVCELKVPPILEQRTIASTLGALDDKIDLNRRMNETLETMAGAIFKDWFVDFGPTIAKTEGQTPYLSPDVWVLFPDRLDDEGKPEGWQRISLREVAEIRSGGTPSKAHPDYWHGTIPWISPKVMTGMHVYESKDRVTSAAIENGTRLAPKDSVLVMVRGIGLHQGVRISQIRRDATFNQDVKALIPKHISGSYLLFALLTEAPNLLSKVESSGHGTGVLPTRFIETLNLILPSDSSFGKMTAFLDDFNNRIAVNNEESYTLTALRKLLLPKLMSGEIRIKDAEKVLEAVL